MAKIKKVLRREVSQPKAMGSPTSKSCWPFPKSNDPILKGNRRFGGLQWCHSLGTAEPRTKEGQAFLICKREADTKAPVAGAAPTDQLTMSHYLAFADCMQQRSRQSMRLIKKHEVSRVI
jgi:hypothetical protein